MRTENCRNLRQIETETDAKQENNSRTFLISPRFIRLKVRKRKQKKQKTKNFSESINKHFATILISLYNSNLQYWHGVAFEKQKKKIHISKEIYFWETILSFFNSTPPLCPLCQLITVA